MNSDKSTRSSSSKVRGRKGVSLVTIATYIGVGMLFEMIVLGAIQLVSIFKESDRIALHSWQVRCAQLRSDFTSIQSSLDIYKLEGGSYPTTAQGLTALVEKPRNEPVPARWHLIIKAEPLDPWKTPYGYKFPGSKDPTKPELISAGPDRHFGNEDDLSSQDP